MAEQSPIRLAVLVDEKWYTDFLGGIANLLRGTGEVEPTLIMCRESAPDPGPELGLPFFRLQEHGGGVPQQAYDLDDITGYERFIAEQDDYFAGRWDEAALSLCAEAERLFDAQPFDCLLVWSGTRLNLRAVTAVARARKMAVVTLETPYFQELPEPPETDFELTLHRMKNKVLIWDTVQAPQCGTSQLSRDWSKARIRAGLSPFLTRLKEQRSSKYTQDDIKRFLSGKADARADAPDAGTLSAQLFRPPDTRVLLVLGQVGHDSARYFGKHLLSDWNDIGREISRRLPKGWILWFKGHPMDRRYQREAEDFAHTLHAINPHCRVLPTTLDIHACYERCDAVACINSTATIEAATYGLPVLNFGSGAFTQIGMSTAVQDLASLEATIAALPKTMTPEQCAVRDQFLSFVLYDYLIPVGSPRKMIARLRQAMAEAKYPPHITEDPVVVQGLGERRVKVAILEETSTDIDQFMRAGEGERPWQVFELTQSQDVRQWVANPGEIALLQPMLEDLGKRLQALNRPVSVLDVGCYGGYVYDYLAKHVFPDPAMLNYTGVDIQERAVAAAARIHAECPNAHFQKADLFNLGASFAPGSFDAVVCYRVMIHLPDFEVAVRNLCQTARTFVHTALWVDSQPRCRRCLETDQTTGQQVVYYHRWVTSAQIAAVADEVGFRAELFRHSEDVNSYITVVFEKREK